MSEVCEDFRAMKEWWQDKRRANTKSSTELLRSEGFEFVVKNGGAHIIIGDFDFWPSTGLFINRKDKKKGRGVFILMKRLRQALSGNKPKAKTSRSCRDCGEFLKCGKLGALELFNCSGWLPRKASALG